MFLSTNAFNLCAVNIEGRMRRNIVGRIFDFYVEGFRQMTWGRTLWLIILLKLFVMFAILKCFFFPDFLAGKGATAHEIHDYVATELVERGVE